MPAFRFLHASDFHLERPPAGLAEMPDHLRDLLAEAPFRSAANVFQAAIEREVDFIVLAGDLVAPERSGPRGVLFLRGQFARLAEQNIGVYWAGGRADRVADWPAAIKWPDNVHIFSADQPGSVTVAKLGKALCRIVGQSLPATGAIDFARFDTELPGENDLRFAIGLAYGDVDEVGQQSERIEYWALGGEHEPTLPQDARPLIHHPGSPQGRSRDEPGPHGCTLVEVTDQGDIRTMPIVSDAVRFVSERLSQCLPTESGTDAERFTGNLERLLRERMELLAETNSDVTLIVDFQLDGSAPHAVLARLPLPAILGVLRGEFGYRSPPVWLDRVRLPPAAPLSESWFQRESLLGDVLRAARLLQHSGESIDLDSYLPGGERRATFRDLVQAGGLSQAQAAIHESANLAVGLLAPEEAR
jgi:DNA repair exonuclease SbcCD nuclease subunit